MLKNGILLDGFPRNNSLRAKGLDGYNE
jgi:hypothetical protein